MAKNKKKMEKGVVLKSDNPEINVVKTAEGIVRDVTHYPEHISLEVKTALFPDRNAEIIVLKGQITKVPPKNAKAKLTYFLGLREWRGKCVENYFLKTLSWKGEDIISFPEGKEDWIGEC